jgi:hypothetical protein
MFGALLGVLGGGQANRARTRPGVNSDQAAKKRQELERRAQEKLNRVYNDPAPMSAEQLERVQTLRRRKQWDVDEYMVSLVFAS